MGAKNRTKLDADYSHNEDHRVAALTMKIKLCSFSGHEIYPGHGRHYTRNNGKVFQFLNGKCEFAFLSKRNPWQINCTAFYRRKHKDGQ
ncbi:60S ribosomal protein L24 [Microtus ochrogaster]|uniref:60S ribosomal protein L24 n=1 Tax=Microtus ochrogaster TaxID=79684 RepID=A0A8J6GFV7_MICOH|nr:60S ribosomal protein L24 [Microtus ochrogaster]